MLDPHLNSHSPLPPDPERQLLASAPSQFTEEKQVLRGQATCLSNLYS